MELVRVAGATINQTPVDWSGNCSNILRILQSAAEQKVDILCFPELSITGYGCEDLFASPHVARLAQESLQRILPATKDMVVVLGLPWLHRNHMYNCAVVVQDGRVIGVNPKRVLAREGVHYEQRWFSPWPFCAVDRVEWLGTKIPFGDVRYQFGTVGVAVEICEEAWGGESSCLDHVASGVELIVNPSASHFALGKMQVRESLVENWSRALKVNYCYTNLLGLEAGRLIYDGGVIIAEAGNIVARGRRFGFDDGSLTYFDCDMDLARVARLRSRSVREADKDRFEPTPVVEGHPLRNLSRPAVAGLAPSHSLTRNSQVLNIPQQRADHKFAEFLHAEMLALIDYMRKSRAKGFVVSLSGGCDSSVVASAVAHGIAQALNELGPAVLAERLGIEGMPVNSTDAKEWVGRLLTCVYQASENSGPVTHAAAQSLAAEIGARFLDARIDGAVAFYLQEFERISGRKLSWHEHDIPLQNIQARARAPLAWLIANVDQALLLTTSNRSEGAVGYATMDGDTAGGLAPIAGIDKKFLREYLVWLKDQTQLGLGPLVSLDLVNRQAPTAELRPPGSRQEDEKDLMPYEVLERMERLFVRDKMGPEEILRVLIPEFPQISAATMREYLMKFLRLWRASQWKRERMAPAFHLDDESLDPKTWCRFPILSGDLTVTQVADIPPVSDKRPRKN
jgi:NAD+ synthase (glutamine-hydrolysing)